MEGKMQGWPWGKGNGILRVIGSRRKVPRCGEKSGPLFLISTEWVMGKQV